MTKRRDLNQTMLVGLGKVLKVLAQILSIGVLSRILSKSDFGISGIGLTVFGFFKLFSEIGFGQAIVKSNKLSNEAYMAAWFASFLIGFLSMIVILVSAEPMAAFFKVPQLVEVFQLLALIIPLESSKGVMQGRLQKDMKLPLVTFIYLLSYMLGYVPFALILARCGYSYFSIVYGLLIASAIEFFLLIMCTSNYYTIKVELDFIKRIIRFSVGLTLNRFVSFATTNLDNLLIGKLMGPVNLGLYSRAYLILSQPIDMIGQSFQGVLYARLSKSKKEEWPSLINFNKRIVAILSIILAGIILVYAKDIISILLGKKWLEIVPVLSALSLAIPARLLSKIGDAYFKASGKLSELIYINTLLMLGVVLVVYFFHSRGLSYISLGLTLIFSFYYFLKELVINFKFKEYEIFNVEACIILISQIMLWLIYLDKYSVFHFIPYNLVFCLTILTIGVIYLISKHFEKNTENI